MKKNNVLAFIVFGISGKLYALNASNIKAINKINNSGLSFGHDNLITGITKHANKVVPLILMNEIIGARNIQFDEFGEIIIVGCDLGKSELFFGIPVDGVMEGVVLERSAICTSPSIGPLLKDKAFSGVFQYMGKDVNVINYSNLKKLLVSKVLFSNKKVA